MKHTFLLLFALFFSQVSNAQSWNAVGSTGFSAGEADYESIAIDRTGTPYVAYQDAANSNKATVMKYNGSSWVNVGIPGFTGDLANFTSIAINNSGTPYVVFQDGADTQKVTVMKFDGSSWVVVGAPGISAGLAGLTSIAFDTAEVPYIAFEDDSFPVGSGQVTVMKFNGTEWAYLGSPRFTGGAQFLAFTIAGVTPYVVYQDSAHGFGATVMKYDGSSWVFVGTPHFSAGLVENVSIAMKNDTPYVAYTDNANSNKATVMMYDGSSWVNVGVAGFTPAEADGVVMAIDSSSGTPYIAYSDVSTPMIAASVMKYDGSSWVNVGSAGFSGTLSNYIGMALDNSGVPYVCYQGFTGGKKASVMKFASSSTEGINNTTATTTAIALSPDPCHGVFTINISAPQVEDVSILITNVLGEKVMESQITTNKETGVQLQAPPGIYFITVITKDEKLTSKIVVE